MLTRMLAAGLLALAVHPVSAGPLDGTQWRMRQSGFVGALKFWQSDTLRFDDDSFTSVERQGDGFDTADYAVERIGDMLTWGATQTNERGETIKWFGTRTGDRMAGTLTLRKADGTEDVLRWEATRVGY